MIDYIINTIQNNKKLLIILIIIVILLIVLKSYLNSESVIQNNIRKYITSKEFVLDKDNIFYEKILSNNTFDQYQTEVKNKNDSTYQELIFDIYSYQLVENLYKYNDGVNIFLSASYNYKSEKLNYSYRTTYKTSNIIFTGSYNNNKFICNTEYQFDTNIENSKEEYCNLIKMYIEEFNNIRLNTITSTKILKDMKK